MKFLFLVSAVSLVVTVGYMGLIFWEAIFVINLSVEFNCKELDFAKFAFLGISSFGFSDGKYVYDCTLRNVGFGRSLLGVTYYSQGFGHYPNPYCYVISFSPDNNNIDLNFIHSLDTFDYPDGQAVVNGMFVYIYKLP